MNQFSQKDCFQFSFPLEQPETLHDLGEHHFGFVERESVSRDEEARNSLAGEYHIPVKPSFVITVEQGFYEIKVKIGSPKVEGITSVKSGLGHIILENIHTKYNERKEYIFTVEAVHGQLSFLFYGENPVVEGLEIKRVTNGYTIYLAGDSTVTDQPAGQYPYYGWGQSLSSFLNQNVAVSNHAHSGRSTKSFMTERRLERILNQIKKGDFLFIQFAHNDEKDNEGGTLADSTYRDYLKKYIDSAKEKGAMPVLITPMHRRQFDENGKIINTHQKYIEAMKQVALQNGVICLDLAAESKDLFERLGKQETKKLFMWSKPGEYELHPNGTEDNTHFTEMGASEIAALVVSQMRQHRSLQGLLKHP
ncbi:rhamnogalacturonan acetylesterase [Alkalihalobacillus trypoxylicola]|uniref:SGNH hydrolase-type esterase domain-containing protein n=1 Tax=Alkalihalobacillus trypoxylicola TaxID=519424 RepID=A0A161PBX8_9BACI|nr:rhamnogalacturonan acetylesterase [Alkalihalobacillus trypoxylicola]KYG29329.1 hypothetical protein AZF04_07330 [Alkalihalobacillus trypoxylicola]